VTDATQENSRTLVRELEIDAPAEAVWEALTDAGELARWFPLQARVEPGAGGSIWMAWGDYWQGTQPIEIWEPPTHLRTIWPTGPDAGSGSAEFNLPDGESDAAPTPLTVDYYVEGSGGRTKLRLVHSGFGKGALWDDWFDGVRRGWDYELESLRHYLENHRGEERSVVWARRTIERRGAAGFEAIFAPGGVLTGSIAGLEPGDPYSLQAPGGTLLQGTVKVNDLGAQFAGTVEALNDAIFRVESFCHGDKQDLSVFVSAWGMDADTLRRIEEGWQARLDAVFSG